MRITCTALLCFMVTVNTYALEPQREIRAGNALIRVGDTGAMVNERLGEPDEKYDYLNAYGGKVAEGWVYSRKKVCLLMRGGTVEAVTCPDL